MGDSDQDIGQTYSPTDDVRVIFSKDDCSDSVTFVICNDDVDSVDKYISLSIHLPHDKKGSSVILQQYQRAEDDVVSLAPGFDDPTGYTVNALSIKNYGLGAAKYSDLENLKAKLKKQVETFSLGNITAKHVEVASEIILKTAAEGRLHIMPGYLERAFRDSPDQNSHVSM